MSLENPLQRCARLLREGQARQAAEVAEAELARDPTVHGLWHMLGAARLAAGDPAGACTALERARQAEPANTAVLDRLGMAFARLGRRDEAAEVFSKVIELRPDSAAGWSNAAANALARRRFSDALRFAERAVALSPELPQACMARANALFELARHDDAADAYRKALALQPSNAKAVTNFALSLSRLGARAEALAALAGLLAQRPELASVRAQYASELYKGGRVGEALAEYRTALEQSPGSADIWSGYLFVLSHEESCSAAEAFAEHRRFGDVIGAAIPRTHDGWENTPDPDRRLRVGFVSGDLRTHAVAYFIEPVWRSFDRSGMSLHVYHTHPVQDDVSRKLRALVDSWEQVDGLDDESLDARIRGDRIDILFDLSGHSAYNRLPVFARKPAPVQVSWIGYPATTGLDAMDYRIVDDSAMVPPRLDPQFVEKLVSLRVAIRLEAEPSLPALTPPPLLRRGYPTFGSFNRAAKINRSSVQLWSEILRRRPDARMLIGGMTDAQSEPRIVGLFEECGIGAERLEFHPRMQIREYLQLHSEVDVLLDTHPYTGGTTTSHALWMGVPTLTFYGDRLSQRQGATHLLRVGLEECVVSSQEEFVERALQLVGDASALSVMRQDLRERMAGTFSDAAAPAEFERALRIMWRRWCAGEPPKAFGIRGDGA